MSILLDNWGGLFSVVGVVVSTVGLAFTFRAARGAQSAAQEAERATLETSVRIGRNLVTVELEKAIALIQRLKLLHREGRWDAALEQYQPLRDMTSAIIARYPELANEQRTQLTEARNQIRIMEGIVVKGIDTQYQGLDRDRIFGQLNRLQLELEQMAKEVGVTG